MLHTDSGNLMVFGFVAIAITSAIVVRIVGYVARKKTMFDMPNERSSHRVPTPRLGGAAFMPIVVSAIVFMAPRAEMPIGPLLALLGGALALFAVGLVDDFFTVSSRLRFCIQSTSAGLFIYSLLAAWPGLAAELDGISAAGNALSIIVYGALLLWIVGLTNFYNFMDGIDGIAGMQALVAGAAWSVFGTVLAAPLVAFMGTAIAAGAAGFLTLNWPPARIFMGDSGSTVLGFMFATVPLVALLETKSPAVGIRLMGVAALVVWPFLLDGSFTVLRRLRNKENIFEAHRSHVYQRLVASGLSHAAVTCIYGFLALVGVCLALFVVVGLPGAGLVATVTPVILFGLLWKWLRHREMVYGSNRLPH